MQLDSTICRYRKDYEVIESDHLDDESSDDDKDSDSEPEEEQKSSNSDQEEEVLDEVDRHIANQPEPSYNSGLDKLVKTGNSNEDAESEEDSSEPSVEELEDEEEDIDRRPSFLDFGEDQNSNDNKPVQPQKKHQEFEYEDAPHSEIQKYNENGSLFMDPSS